MPLDLRWLGPRALCREQLGFVPHGLPGVYLLQHFSEVSGTFPAFYVGQSCDLRRRLAEHLKSSASGVWFFRTRRPTYFSAAHVLPFLLDDVERSLIQLLMPPANDRTPHPDLPLLPNIPHLQFKTYEH